MGFCRCGSFSFVGQDVSSLQIWNEFPPVSDERAIYWWAKVNDIARNPIVKRLIASKANAHYYCCSFIGSESKLLPALLDLLGYNQAAIPQNVVDRQWRNSSLGAIRRKCAVGWLESALQDLHGEKQRRCR